MPELSHDVMVIINVVLAVFNCAIAYFVVKKTDKKK